MSAPHGVSGRRAVEIAESVERSVESGQLHPGERLPTVRDLAQSLDVSPTTVASAYRMLRERGIIRTHGRGGTRISGRPPIPLPEVARPATLESVDDDAELLEVLAKDLAADQVPVGPVRVAPDDGSALAQLLATATRPGDRVIIEDPTPPEVAGVIASSGLSVIRVAVDESGMVPSRLRRALRNRPKATILTLRGHEVTGAAMDEARVTELEEVLGHGTDRLLVARDPLGSVAGGSAVPFPAENLGRWAVVRGLAASLGPDLPLAVVAGDDLTMARLGGRQRLTGGRVPRVVQSLAGEILRSTEGQRTIALATRTYGARRITFLAELRRRGIEATAPSGLCVWFPLVDEASATEELAGRGFAVAPTRARGWSTRPGLRVAVGRMSSSVAARLADDLLETFALR
jgi:DNA-binding transcriptional MocR family regulator